MTRASVSETPELVIVGSGTTNSELARILTTDDGVIAQRPTAILLDGANHGDKAWEILHNLKSDPRLQRVPVIFVGASPSPDEKTRAYKEGANSYVAAPGEGTHVDSLLQRIEDFWLTRVRLPTG
jgi:CheY-like chemotaxis protein